MSSSASHIRFEQLVDLVEGRLSPEEAARVERLVAASEQYTAELAALRHMIQLMRADESADAPPEVIARAVRLFRPGLAPERRPSLRERIIAALTFDSGQMPLAFGVRGAPPEARQMLFTANDYKLDVRITPRAQGWQVAGQVLGTTAQTALSGEVLLQGAHGSSAQAALSALGEFALPPVAPGRYALVARVATDDASVEIEIPELVLGN